MQTIRKPRLRPTLLLLLAILPAVFTGILIVKYAVDQPLWDEWLIAGYLDKFSQGTLTVHDLYQQQNEYRQFFPNLIFVALGWVTAWDLRSWMAVSFFLAVLVSFNVFHLGKFSLRETNSNVIWPWLIANVLIFSPAQYDNWIQGQQVVYFLPIACLTAALLVASSKLRIGLRFTLCALLSIVGSFSSVNGMLCWVLLLPVLVWSPSREQLWRKKWWIVAWVLGLILTVAIYFQGYETPVQHDPRGLAGLNPLNIIIFFLGVLGRPLVPARLFAAVSVGLVLFGVFIWCCFVWWRERSTSQAKGTLCWLMIAAYSILTAVLITVGRATQTTEVALAHARYTTFSIYLPVALVYLISIAAAGHRSGLRFLGLKLSKAQVATALGILLIVLHIPIYLLGIRQMSSFRAWTLQSKACSLFVNVIQDDCLTKMVYPDIDTLKRKINPIDRLAFIRPGLFKSNLIDDIGRHQNGKGVFEGLAPAEGDRYVASGWAMLADRSEPVDAVLLAYQQEDGRSIIFAIAQLSNERDFVSAFLRRGSYGNSRWSKSFPVNAVDPATAKITAWGFDAYTGKAYKLDGEHVFRKSTNHAEK